MIKYLNIKKYSNLDWLFMSLLLYDFFFTLGPVILSKLQYNAIQLVAVLIFFIAFVKERRKFSFKSLDADVKVVFFLFLFWNFWVVLYSLVLQFNVRLLMLYIVQPISFLIYITPLFMLIRMDEGRIKILSGWLFVKLIIAIIAYFLLYNKIAVVSSLGDINIEGSVSLYSYLNIAQYPSSCFVALSFVFFYSSFTSKWKQYLLWFGFFLSVVAALLLGRRSSAAIPILVVFIKFIYDFYHNPKMLLFIIVLAFAIYLGFDYLEEKFLSTFVVLQDRVSTNTRYWVEHDFYKDMTGLDYIVGRGSEGLIYSSELGYRPIIETGYLNMILHGGVIYLFLYLYLLLSAAWKGLRTKNPLLKSMALYILISVACLYPGGHLSFSLNTMSLWICVACCSRRNFRNIKTNVKL